jgi:hypothetical protein
MNKRILMMLLESKGPWSPAKLSSLAFWAKADSGVYTDAAKTTLATDGQLVYTWVDRKNGADLVQATEANRPTYNINQINGKPVLTFNATHWLTSTYDQNNGYSMAYILYTTEGDANKYICASNAALNNYIYIRSIESVRISAGTIIDPFPSGSYPLSIAVCLYVIYNGASSNAELNGTVGTAADAGTTALTDLRVGCKHDDNGGWIGQIAEVVYFSEVLSAANKLKLYSYFSDKYGITFA